jgi:GT2 family glycosyltransferase
VHPVNDPLISIVMPVFNQASLTGDRLLELDRLFHIRHDFELIIVNNASTDRTREMLKWWKDHAEWRMLVKHCRNNLGFGPGHNLGARSARGEYLFLLSNDVVIEGDFLANCLQFMQTHPGEFICAPRVIDWPAGWNEFPGTLITYAEGWLLAMKTLTWRRLGGFDERYQPCDYEDVDLSYKAAQEGVQLRQVLMPVHHLGAATAGYNPARRQFTDDHRHKFAEKWGLEWTPVA